MASLMYIVHGLLCTYSSTNFDRQIVLYHYMQNALAVGETQEIKENAELTTLKLRVSSSLHLCKFPWTPYSQHVVR